MQTCQIKQSQQHLLHPMYFCPSILKIVNWVDQSEPKNIKTCTLNREPSLPKKIKNHKKSTNSDYMRICVSLKLPKQKWWDYQWYRHAQTQCVIVHQLYHIQTNIQSDLDLKKSWFARWEKWTELNLRESGAADE